MSPIHVLFVFIFVLSQPGQTAEPSFEVKRYGSGQAVIMIPGLSCSGQVFEPTAKAFADRFQSHVLTLPGFAGVASIESPYFDTLTNELAAYIRDQGLQKPIVMGHSLGGFLAFKTASEHPNLVGPIIAVDGVPFMPALGNPAATPSSSEPYAKQMRDRFFAMDAQQFKVQNRAALTSMITNPAHVDQIATASEKSDPAAVGQAVYEMMTTDLRRNVGAIKTPVLLMAALGPVNGDLKTVMKTAMRNQITAIPNASLQVFQTRHFIMLDAPEDFEQRVLSFLETHLVEGGGL